MNERSDPRLIKQLSIVASTAGIVPGLIGLSVLTGWTFHVAALLTWGAGTPMAPNAAGCTVLASASLWLLKRKDSYSFGVAKKLAARIAAGVVTVVGLLSLAEHLFDLNFGIDRLLLLAPLSPQTAAARVLMSPVSGGFFLLVGCALLGIDWRTRRGDWPAQFLSIGAMIGVTFGLFGLILGPAVSPIRMALPSVLSYFLLTFGVLCSRPTWAVGGLLVSQNQGASLVRKAVPGALLALSLVGMLISRALLTESHFTWIEVSLLGVFCSALLASFIVWMAFLVERSNEERKTIEGTLHIGEEQLARPLNRVEEPQDEKLLRRKVNLGFAVAVLLTIFLSAFSWHASQLAGEDANRVAHTHEVSTTLEFTLRHLDDVETGGRGFALTGDDQFLEPYEAGKYAVGQDLQALHHLVADNPDQLLRLNVLAQQANARIAVSVDLVGSRRSSGAFPTITQLEQGKRLMDDARVTIEKMESAENRLLELRTQRTRSAQRLNTSAIGLGLILGIIFLSLAGMSVSREIGVSARARAQVNALNEDLEKRVEQRTAALQSEIAARTSMEAKLRASEETFRMLLDGIKDYAVYLLDSEGRVMSWNSGAARMKGYVVEEIIGKDFSCFYTETDRSLGVPQESLKKAAQAGRFESEGWRMRKDGSKFWADAVITPVYEAGGALRGYSKIVRDITEGKQSEDELKKQAILLDLAHDAILVRDLQNRVIFWNRGAQSIYGWSAGEALGKVTHDFLQTKFPQPLDTIEVTLASKGDWEGELRHKTRHGPEVVVASRWSLQRDTRGLPAAIMEINRDITDRKRAEAALSDSEGRLAGIIASAMDCIITVDEQQRIVLFNCAAEKMFRCPAEEAIGQPLTRFIPERFHASHGEHIRKFGETGVTNRAMGPKDLLWALRADGQEFQIEASISHVVTGGKKLFTVILRDVTERKQAEEMRERLAAVVDSSDDAIIGKTLDGVITSWNRGAEKVFGYSPSEAVGKSMLMLFPADRLNEESDILTRISHGESVEHYETERVRKDGTKIVVSVTISPIRDGNGAIVGASKIARDISESKMQEAELRESKERFQAMANGIPQLAWMAEADGHIFWYNQRWYEYTGTTFEQMEGWAWQTVHDPEMLPKVMERWRESIASGAPFDMEFPLRGADGKFRMFLTRIQPVKDAEGRVVRWLGTNTDISERTRAEQRLTELAQELSHRAEELVRSREALEAQTAMFKLVLASMGEGLIAADREGRFLIFNDAAHNLMGRGPEDLPTERWTQHYNVFLQDGITPYPPDRLPLVRALHGESVQVELIVELPETLSKMCLEVTARPIKDARGNLCGGVAVLRDITERKRSESELARQADELFRSRQDLETQTLMLQSVLDSMEEGLVVADEQGKFITWNPAAARIVGLGGSHLPPEEWRAHYRTYLPDTVTLFPEDQNPLLRAIRGETSTAEMFIRNPKLDHGIWIESNGAALRDKRGVLRGGVVAFRDITQKKADELMIRKLHEDLEERIAQRTAQLEAANHELEAFTYSVSHDLRAPLRHIASFSKILADDFGAGMDPEARRHLERIEKGARRMTLLVDGLLSLARLGQQSLKLSLTELNAIVDGVISILQPERDGGKVEWRVARLPAVECDPILVGQVFQNLLGNALKYSSRRDKPIIEIDSIQEPGKPPVIFVRDNGAGFSMKHAEKLFGVFQRMHSDAEFEGTGVGLATVNRIIQRHGGSIWADAEVDHGATFYFTVGEKAAIETIKETTKSGGLERVHDSRS